jgi:hypothetical protein
MTDEYLPTFLGSLYLFQLCYGLGDEPLGFRGGKDK